MKNAKKKKIVGYTTGVFDLFHIGHLNILKRARAQCDELIVGVTTDELAMELKGKKPFIPFSERCEIVEGTKYVNRTVPQAKIDEIQDWEDLNFDIIFKGDDWKGTEKWKDLEKKFKKRGVKVEFLPYTKSTSSSMLKSCIENENGGRRKLKRTEKFKMMVSQGCRFSDKFKIASLLLLEKFFNISTLKVSIFMKNDFGIFSCRHFRDFRAYNVLRERELTPYFRLYGENEIFIDVGSNLGRYAIMVANEYENCEVFAIEPDNELLPIFEKNLKLNGVEGRVKIIDKIAYYKKTKKKLYLNVQKPERNTIYEEEILGVDGYTNKDRKNSKFFDMDEIEVETTTLDLLTKDSKKKVGLIKLDVQGAELDVLNGSKKLIKKDKPNIIFEAWDKAYYEKIKNFLINYDYEIQSIDDTNYFASFRNKIN